MTQKQFIRFMLIYDRSKALQGTTVVLSGLIPLNADLLRYLNTISPSQFTHDLSFQVLQRHGEEEDELTTIQERNRFTSTKLWG